MLNTLFVQILGLQLIAIEPTAQMCDQSKLVPDRRTGIPLACEQSGKSIDIDRQWAYI